MEKRLFVAVVASIAFLWLWAALAPRLFPELVKPKPVPVRTSTPVASSSVAPPPPASGLATVAPSSPQQPAPSNVAILTAREQEFSTVETPSYVARFTNRGAQLVSFRLKQYKAANGDPVDLVKGRSSGQTDFPFSIESSDVRASNTANSALYVLTRESVGSVERLEYRLAGSDGTRVTKLFKLGPGYEFDFSVTLENPSVPFRVMTGPGIRTIGPEERDSQFVVTGNGIIQQDGSLSIIAREKAPRLKFYEGASDFVGIEDNYFLTVFKPKKAGGAVLRSIELPPGDPKAPKRKEIFAGLNATGGTVEGTAFFGPKQANILETHHLEKTLQFGHFGIIARFLLTALIAIHKFTKNYGLAIIVLTVLIKLVLYPLQHKSIVSMKKMQRVQPKMNAIRDRFKKAKTDAEQRQKMNVEMMKLYQQEGISPMGGCLPLLLQLPILWGFYGLLARAIELRGAPFFGWIHDLSAKDPYYITPILMTITMFIQQAITPSTADPTQKKIFMAMPFVFGWIFKEFSSGLVLYWLVQNVLTIVQQMIMNRYWAEHPEA